MIIEDKKILKKLFIASWIIYFTSYTGRLNYAASMLAIGAKEGYTTSELGLVITALFISYGVGQLLSGVLGDKISPIKLIVLGLSICSACNLAMGLVEGIYVLVGVWFVNGFGLALIWPPMMKIFSRHMPVDYLKKCCFNIQTSVAIGTFATYLFCSIIVAKFDWRWVFYTSSILLFIAAIGAYKVYTSIENYVKTEGRERVSKQETRQVEQVKSERRDFNWQLLVSSGFVIILGVILVMGFLKDGIMTWVPQYLADTFKLNEYFSIFLSAVLPIVNVLGIYVGKFIYQRTGDDDLKTTVFLYGVSMISLIGLMVFGESSVTMSIVMFASVTSCMLGINTILIGVLPTYFEPYGKTSTVAGITNSVTYMGSALCGYGLGVIVEKYGWEVTRLILVGICGLAIILCGLAFSRWKKFKMNKEDSWVQHEGAALNKA